MTSSIFRAQPLRRRIMAEAEPDLWKEQQRFYNFLQHYDLHKYHRKFLATGVSKISHLKAVAVDDQSLADVGLTRPERIRLRKKLEANFSVGGKLKKYVAGKASRFDQPAPEQAHRQNSDASKDHTASLIAKESIKIGKKIGEGAHGAVHEGTWANVHGSVTVAVKMLYGKHDVQAQFIKEADSMRALNHHHIIRLYGIVLSAPLMLVEEVAPFGNLLRHLQQNGPTLNLSAFHLYAHQIADAMKYLESRRVVHRDLAARNILLAAEDFVKLSDFGMARILDEYSEVYNLSNLQDRIPIAWTALEALTHAKFSTASDVWSYAVTLWEIYSLGQTPWERLTPVEVRDNLVQGERLGRPVRCPPEMYRLMLACWEKDPKDRPSFATVCARVENTPPRKVRAHKGHNVAAGDNSLNFRPGEIIYIIERPKNEWIFGMKANGEVGHFLADHVSEELEPLTNLKEKVQSGKAKASEMHISEPTSMSHEYHWGRDGNKWVAEETDDSPSLARQMRSGARVSQQYEGGRSSRSPGSSREASRSPLSPATTYNIPRPAVRSPSPLASSQPHTAARRSASNSSSGQSGTRSPDELISISQISYADSTFLGDQRYAPNPAGLPQPKPQQEEVEAQLQDLDIGQQESQPTAAGHSSENDQYVTIFSPTKGSGFLEGIPDEQQTQRQQYGLDIEGPENDGYNYLKMAPAPAQLPEIHSYGNASAANGIADQPRKIFSLDRIGQFREEVPAYAVTGGRAHVHSSASNSTESRSQRSTPSLVTSPVPEYGYSNPLEDTTGVDPLSLAEPLLPSPPPSLPPPPVPRRERVERTLEPTSSPTGPSSRFVPPAHSSSTNPFLPRGGSAYDLPTSSRASVQSRQYSHAGSEYRAGFTAQKSVSVDVQPTTASPAARVNRSSSFESRFRPRQQGTPGSSSHSIPESPKTFSSSESPTGMCAVLIAEFPDISPELCRQALECARYDLQKAREEVQIQLLLQMGMTFVTAEDCRRALSHCQWKVDRAALWLLEQSVEITTRIS